MDNAVIPNRSSKVISFTLDQTVEISQTQPYTELLNGFRLSGTFTPGIIITPADAASQSTASIQVKVPQFLSISSTLDGSIIDELTLTDLTITADHVVSGVSVEPFLVDFNGFEFTVQSISFDRMSGLELLDMAMFK